MTTPHATSFLFTANPFRREIQQKPSVAGIRVTIPRVDSITRIVRSASALWPYYLGVLLTATVSAILALTSPFIVRGATNTIVDAVQGGTDSGDALRKVLIFAAFLFLADAANSVFKNIGGYIGDVMVSRLRQILSTRYFAKLLSLPQGYYDNQVTGTIIARLDRSIMFITMFVQSFANNFFSTLIQVAAVLAITAWYYWPLAVLLAALFPVYMWLTALTSKRWQKFEKDKNEQIDVANGRFAEVIGQIKVTKSFVAEPRELKDFARHYGKYVSTTQPQSRWWHSMDTIRGLAMALLFFGIYAVIFWRTLHGYFSIGDMVMLLQMVTMAKQPVFMMSWIVDSAQRAIAGSRDYFKVMEEPVERTANTEVVAATTAADEPDLDLRLPQPLVPHADAPVFSFRDVEFAYEKGKPVIQGISFHADEGAKSRVGRRVRRRQVHAGQPATRPVYPVRGPAVRPRPRRARSLRGGATRLGRRRLSGAVFVLRDDPRKHRLRKAGRHGRGDRRRGQARQRARVHQLFPGRLRHYRRRARPAPVRRPEATRGGGPGDA